MKKLLLIFLSVVLCVTLAVALIACDNTPETPSKKDITGITFSGDTVEYDGKEHQITVSGTVPEGVSVSYSNNKGTEVGVYNATATLSGEGYNTLTLNATLTITGKNIIGITFENATFPYDKQSHEITISGELPEGVTVEYKNNTATNYGVTNATAILSGKGYNTLTLTATLTIEAKDITGITFENKTVPYNGEAQTIEQLTGTLPAGVTPTYSNNVGTDVGTYKATVELWGIGYKPLTLSATLTIEPIDITVNLKFENASVEYDGKQHSIQVVGNVPSGVTVVYYYNNVEATGVTSPGVYEVKAVLSGKNYNPLELTATLTIKSNEEMLYSAFFNGAVYFQNSLDGNKLYRATNTGTPIKISNDVATYFTSNASSLYFYSGSLYTQTIKSLSNNTISTIFNPGRSTYLTSDNDGNIYYSKANLIDTKGENGIYKVHIDSSSTEEATAVRLTTDKANFLAYYNGYIYYCNTSDGSKLYRISVNANNGTGQQLSENKVSDIIVEDGNVYYTSHTLTDSSIQKYNISSGTTTKLCIDNGAYLTKIGNYIYYVNKDLLTSNIYGKGIYRVSTSGGNTMGEKVLESNDGEGYYSLASDGTYIYYYKLSNKHFCRNNVSGTAETDLMENFVPTETTVFSASPYAHIESYNGEIYYTDVLDGNSLYKYNPVTNAIYKVLADSVSNVYFYNDYMYYSTYIFTNYALWRVDLKTANAEPEKISSHRYEHLIFDGNYIYALRVQPPIVVGQNFTNRIVRLDLDGQNETILYMDKNVHITSMYLENGVFHFTINPAVGFKYIYTHNLEGAEDQATNTEIRSDKFVICGGKYFYVDQGNLIGGGKGLKLCNMDGTGEQTILSGVDITDIFEYGGKIYYTVASGNSKGIYVYDVATETNTRITDKVGHGFEVLNGKLYFVNISLTWDLDYPQRGEGDGHLYSIDLSNHTVTKVA